MPRRGFEDEQTQRWLGGPGWPALVLRLAADPRAEYRRCRVTGRFAWLAYTDQVPIGLVDIERYADATAGVALVVDPVLRSQGLGRRIIEALVARPELEATEIIRAGIEPGMSPACAVSQRPASPPKRSRPTRTAQHRFPGRFSKLGLEFADLVYPLLDPGVCGVFADAADGPAHDLCAVACNARGDQGVYRGQIGGP